MSAPTDETVVQARVEPVDQTLVQDAVSAQPPTQPAAVDSEDEGPPVDWGNLIMVVIFAISIGIFLVMAIGIIMLGKREVITPLLVGAVLMGSAWGLWFYSLDLIRSVQKAFRRRRS